LESKTISLYGFEATRSLVRSAVERTMGTYNETTVADGRAVFAVAFLTAAGIAQVGQRSHGK